MEMKRHRQGLRGRKRRRVEGEEEEDSLSSLAVSTCLYTYMHTDTPAHIKSKYTHTPLEPFLIRKLQGKLGFLKAQLQYLLAFAKLIKALAQNEFIYGAPGMGWKERLGRDSPALRLNTNTLPPVTQGLAL